MKEVSSFICSLGWIFWKNTDVAPDPQTEDDRVTSIHARCRILGSFGGILIGKHGLDSSQDLK